MAFDWQQLTTDFKQRYEGTYVFVTFPETQKEDLFYVARIDQTQTAPIITLTNEELGNISLNYDTSCELGFRFPEIGYSFYKGAVAIYFRRLSARRWKRGVCKENSTISNPYSYFTNLNIAVTEDSLRAAFHPVYVPWTTAHGMLSAGALSVPLDRNLCLGLSPSGQIGGKILWFGMKPIAISDSPERILIRESSFQQEILDYTRKGRVDAQVI